MHFWYACSKHKRTRPHIADSIDIPLTQFQYISDINSFAWLHHLSQTIYRKYSAKTRPNKFFIFFSEYIKRASNGTFFCVCAALFSPFAQISSWILWSFYLKICSFLIEIERIPNSIFIFPTFCQMSRSATSKHERLVKFLWAIYLLWIETPPFNHFASWFWVKIYSVQPSIL